jgi:hypothetical protein
MGDGASDAIAGCIMKKTILGLIVASILSIVGATGCAAGAGGGDYVAPDTSWVADQQEQFAQQQQAQQQQQQAIDQMNATEAANAQQQVDIANQITQQALQAAANAQQAAQIP